MFGSAFAAPALSSLQIRKPTITSKARKLLADLPLNLAKPLSHTPFFVQKKLMHQVLSRVFTEALNNGEVDFLLGHWLKIEVIDMKMAWFFSCGANREVLIQPSGSHDVCIRGNLNCFIKLAAQKEDPDTLFFQRDLSIEGDTNLGLEVKNLLDRVELVALPPEVRFALAGTAELITAFENNQ